VSRPSVLLFRRRRRIECAYIGMISLYTGSARNVGITFHFSTPARVARLVLADLSLSFQDIIDVGASRSCAWLH